MSSDMDTRFLRSLAGSISEGGRQQPSRQAPAVEYPGRFDSHQADCGQEGRGHVVCFNVFSRCLMPSWTFLSLLSTGRSLAVPVSRRKRNMCLGHSKLPNPTGIHGILQHGALVLGLKPWGRGGRFIYKAWVCEPKKPCLL